MTTRPTLALRNQRLLKPLLFGFFALLIVLLSNRPDAVQAAGDLYVDVQRGADTASCGTQAQPCASIQHAVNRATSGTTIRVAAGTYTYNAAADTCSNLIGTTGVVCIIHTNLTILGGYSGSNWSSANPAANPTIISGQNSRRGVYVRASSLVMDGFTVANGRVQGASSGSDGQTFAFGAGMHAESSQTILRNMVFRNNVAVGGGANNDYGGSASGGGIALAAGLAGSTLTNITLENNQAIGGDGRNRGGYAIGGGLFTFRTSVTGFNVTATDNTAIGGNSGGSGRTADGAMADAQGGAVGVQIGSTVSLQYLTATGNKAIGGAAQNAGGGFGGAVAAEGLPATGDPATLILQDSDIRGNEALGGDGVNGGIAGGGGVETIHTHTVLERVRVVDNRALGGDGSGNQGPAGGGGLYLHNIFDGSAAATVSNSVIADNFANVGSGSLVGGGGGGVWLQGIRATLSHTTIVGNRLGSPPMQGSAVLALNFGAVRPTEADIVYSIIGMHTGAAAVQVHSGNVVNLNRVLFSGNSLDTKDLGGTINGLSSITTGSLSFVSPGAPNYDYHIREGSAAKNAAVGSPERSDLDFETRDGQPDLGADEYLPARITALYAFSTSTGSVRVVWNTQGSGIERYEIMVTCPGGASRPNEIQCGDWLNVGQQQEVQLTGLTNGVEYAVKVEAYGSGDQEVHAMSAWFFTADHFLFLPKIKQ